MEDVCRHLGVTDVYVLAHDYGVTVAQELMAREQSRQSPGGSCGGGEALDLILDQLEQLLLTHAVQVALRAGWRCWAWCCLTGDWSRTHTAQLLRNG